jgi:hypothetical protein
MFNPGSDHFLIPYPDPNIFYSRILHEKWNANLLFSCFLCIQEQSLSLSHSQKDLRSGKNSSRIRIMGPGSRGWKSTGSRILNTAVKSNPIRLCPAQHYPANINPPCSVKVGQRGEDVPRLREAQGEQRGHAQLTGTRLPTRPGQLHCGLIDWFLRLLLIGWMVKLTSILYWFLGQFYWFDWWIAVKSYLLFLAQILLGSFNFLIPRYRCRLDLGLFLIEWMNW